MAMPDDIQKRLSKVPPFDDDVPTMRNLKRAKEQQTPPVEEEVVEEEVKVEPVEEKVEEKVEEPKKVEKKDRTSKQFDKLKEHNKQLKEENEKLYKDVLSSLKPDEAPQQEFTPEFYQQVDKHTTELPQTKVDDIFANLIDENGYIDQDLLIKTLREANEIASQARKDAEMARKEAEMARHEARKTKQDFEESKEVRLVHKKYPQIDPKSDKFNEKFWDDVRKEIATAPILRGVNVSFMDAADKIWEERYAPAQQIAEEEKEVEEVNKKQKEEVEEKEDAKRNINASVPAGQNAKAYFSKADDELLRQASIKGVRGALAERLKRSGY